MFKKKKIKYSDNVIRVRQILKGLSLNTVCQGAKCPNMCECFEKQTATFMILGDTCTRNCRFCAVKYGTPKQPDKNEPSNIALAVEKLGLKYVVVTSVTRDDLKDFGAEQFIETIKQIRKMSQNVGQDTRIEILVPDFNGNENLILKVASLKPDVFNHNLETVERLTPEIRDSKADYKRSLALLELVKENYPQIYTKSGLMVGLGETFADIKNTIIDLSKVKCDILTVGQYLKPANSNFDVAKYYTEEEFAMIKEIAVNEGIKKVFASFYVRSSYCADEIFTHSENP